MINDQNYVALLEAVLFANAVPMTTAALAELIDCSLSQTDSYLKELQAQRASSSSGIKLVSLENKWQLCTKEDFAEVVKRSLEIINKAPLSKPALEVLSIIAYKQPVSRSYIDQVRGVDSGYLLRQLLDKLLIEEAGRLDLPGRPIVYQTTSLFLRSFSLTGLCDLPPLPKEYQQLSMESADENAVPLTEKA